MIAFSFSFLIQSVNHVCVLTGDALPPSLSLNTSSLSENVTTSGSERISLTQGEVRVFPQTASVISSDSDGLEIEITLHQPPDGLQEDMFLIVNPSRAVSVSSERSLVDNSFTLRLSGEANDSEYSQVRPEKLTVRQRR